MSGSILQAGSYAYITTTIRPIKAFPRSDALGGVSCATTTLYAVYNFYATALE